MFPTIWVYGKQYFKRIFKKLLLFYVPQSQSERFHRNIMTQNFIFQAIIVSVFTYFFVSQDVCLNQSLCCWHFFQHSVFGFCFVDEYMRTMIQQVIIYEIIIAKYTSFSSGCSRICRKFFG